MSWIRDHKVLPLILCVLLACSDDDGDGGDANGVGPDTGEPLSDEELFLEVGAAFQQAAALLFLGGGAVPGAGGGQITVAGNVFTYEDFSPGGDLVVNGPLVFDLLAEPLPTVTGTLSFARDGEVGEAVVDMTVDPNVTPFALGGTVTIDGEVYDIAELTAGG